MQGKRKLPNTIQRFQRFLLIIRGGKQDLYMFWNQLIMLCDRTI